MSAMCTAAATALKSVPVSREYLVKTKGAPSDSVFASMTDIQLDVHSFHSLSSGNIVWLLYLSLPLCLSFFLTLSLLLSVSLNIPSSFTCIWTIFEEVECKLMQTKISVSMSERHLFNQVSSAVPHCKLWPCWEDQLLFLVSYLTKGVPPGCVVSPPQDSRLLELPHPTVYQLFSCITLN